MNIRVATGGVLVGLTVLGVTGCGNQGQSRDPARPPDASASAAGAPMAAKRVAPPVVPPVTVGDFRIEAVHWGRERGLGQNGGHIAAVDPHSGEELWVLRLYEIQYDAHLEEDVQDVFIASMQATPSGESLDVTDELGRHYRVDVRERTVEQR